MDLSDNHIHWLQRGQFRTSDKLQKLILARNKISEIGTGAFGSCQNLKLLDLKVGLFVLFLNWIRYNNLIKSNLLKSLRDGLFDPCENLSFLFLGGNSLKSVSDDFLLKNRWIRTIDLSQNELQSVPDSLSKGKPLLKSKGSKTFF